MAIKKYAGDKLVGLSSDTKPSNIPDGATFYESDTYKSFIKTGGSWIQTNANVAIFLGAANNTGNSTGIFTNGVINALALTTTANVVTNTVSATNVNATNISGNLTGNIVASNVNTSTLQVNSSITLDNNNALRFKTVNTSAVAYFIQQSDDNFVFYTTDAAYNPRAVFSIFANSSTSDFQFGQATTFNGPNVKFSTGTALIANGSAGSAGQVLTSDGTKVYWSTVSGGPGGSVNVDAQYAWTNTHTFSANVSFTGNGIGLASNTGAIYLGGIADANWKIGRNTGVVTKTRYTNNTIDIITANSNLEGMTIGLVSGNSYFETGYLGTFIASNVTIGNSTVNATINATTFSGTANNANNLGGVAAASYIQNTDSRTLSGNLIISGTYFNPSANNILLGNTTARWNIAATNIDAFGTVTAFSGFSSSGGASLQGMINTTSGMHITGTTQNVNIASQTTGSLNLGGATQTGGITIGVSTANQTVNLATGATTSGNVKTLNIGTSGAAGSQTNITIGSSLANTLLSINANTTTFSGNISVGNSTVNVYANNTAFVGNVVATSLSGNLTGNVTATAISGNLTGNVTATTISGNLTGNVSATTVSATGNVTVGANVFMNLTSHVILGNTTTAPTVTLTGTGLTAGNTSITGAPQVIVANTSGTTTINANFISTTSISGNLTGNVTATTISGNLTGNVSATTVSATGNVTVGANVFMNLTSHVVLGNTTTAPTVTLTGTGLTAGNTTITGAPQIVIANSAGNTTINTTSTVVGSNAVHNLTSFAILGNTTTAPTTTMTGSGVTSGNTSITGAPQIIVANTSGTTTINANFISTTSISGNLTGNVIATTISGNLTGNVIATTATFGSVVVANASGLYVNSTTSDIYINSSAGIWANGTFGTAGHVLTTNGSAVYWAAGGSSGETVYMKGGTATVGTLAGGGQNIFRINANTLNNSTTIAAGENATAAGPLVVASGVSLVVDTGGRVVIT